VDERGNVTKSDVDLIRWRCQKDLKFLCKAIFGYKDWSENQRLHYDIARKLRAASKFKLFLIPRDHLKSSIITKAGAVQRVLNNPDIRVLIANNTWDNARKFLGSIQKHLKRGAYLSYYFGAFESEKWNQDEIVIKQRTQVLDAPTIATTGLEKEQTSQHYDLIIADDLVARENVQTKEQREKVKDYINSLMALLEPQGELWVVGTRWSQDDAYGDLLEEGIWDTMIRGCYDTESAEKRPIFPEKFSLEKLDFLRAKLGPVLFSCWYLNNPIAEEAADFKCEQIRYYEAGTPHPSALYLAVDPAMSLGADADYSAGIVGGMFADRRIRIVDYFRKKVIPSNLIDEIFKMVKKWNLRRVGVETFMFQKTLRYEIERKQREENLYFSIDDLGKRHSGRGEPLLSKEARIRMMQPLFEQGLIEIRRDMTDFVDELLSFPRGRNDDLIDATAWLIEKLIPSAGLYKSGDDEKYGTMDWWLKNHMPKAESTIYERFMADLK
jgi:predicted phage terminase large subunit-like protein